MYLNWTEGVHSVKWTDVDFTYINIGMSGIWNGRVQWQYIWMVSISNTFGWNDISVKWTKDVHFKFTDCSSYVFQVDRGSVNLEENLLSVMHNINNNNNFF